MKNRHPIAERRRAQQSGNAMVETALTLTVLLMMVMGTMEFGRMAFTYNQLAYLAQEGARYASVRGSSVPAANQATQSSVSAYVSGMAIALPAPLTITTTWQSGKNTPGNWVNCKCNIRSPSWRLICPQGRSSCRPRRR